MSYLTDAADRLDGHTEYPTPGALAVDLDPRTRQSKVLRLLDAALVDVAEGRAPSRLLFVMPPQEGKSERVSRRFTLWMLKRNPDYRIAVVSYAQNLAERWGRRVREDIEHNPRLGLRLAKGSAAVAEWQLDGHDGGMICVGIGAGITGRPVDVLIIDDPFKDREEADSEAYRERAEDWWRESGSNRLGGPRIVICIMTRWHEDDLGGLFERDGSFRVIRVPAVADHRPELGETDPIGRQPGQIMPSVRGWTLAEWQQKKKDSGSRGWAGIYQGRPAPAEGTILLRKWWRYHSLMPRQKADGTMFAPGVEEYLISMDCSFKDTSKSDYVCIQVWGRAGSRARLLAQIYERMDFPTAQGALLTVCAQWPQARVRLIEDTANGPAIMQSLRGVVGGLIPVTPQGSKEARVHAVSPFVEAGDVELPHPSLAPFTGAFIDQCAAFPNASHDDMVDTFSQAVERLLGQGTGLAGFMGRLKDQRRAA